MPRCKTKSVTRPAGPDVHTPAPAAAPVVAVVEDDASLRRALGRLLRTVGFSVRPYGSAEEFLDAPPEPRPACLVLDVHLGELDAFALHERLHSLGTDVPTIFMSGHDNPENRERARKAGAVAYLRKPFEDEVLISAIERAAARERTLP